MRIINCHTHLFTMRHIPRWYYFGLAQLVRPLVIRRPLFLLLRLIQHFLLRPLGILSDSGQLDRLEAFAAIGAKRSQRDVFNEYLSDYYPRQTHFVVLPMDLEKIGYGRAPEGIEAQHEELAKLRDENAEEIIPFIHFDPRRPDALERIRYWHEQRGFKGLKLYPPLGYRPDEEILDPIFAYCQARQLPVLSHCSGATVRSRKHFFSSKTAAALAAPNNYLPVLEKYPDLRLCLAHFGGDRAWEIYHRDPAQRGKYANDPAGTWLGDIRSLLQNPKYTNVYTDIAYVIFHFADNVPLLKILLAEERIAQRVLFGSDFYLVEMENLRERYFGLRLRAALGEELFRQIAEINPRNWLQQPS
jgi:predicted TIM-barrel fold metal-dependent hydrolase